MVGVAVVNRLSLKEVHYRPAQVNRISEARPSPTSEVRPLSFSLLVHGAVAAAQCLHVSLAQEPVQEGR
jgi:hypothetical protein